jgi:hypothetical protein
MTKTQIAKMIGLKTRQGLDYVLSGERNFSFAIAKNATRHIGGTIEIWMDPTRATERIDVFRQFRERQQCNH